VSAIVPHLAALLVVIPLISAPLCVLIGQRHVAWFIVLLASALSFVIAMGLTADVLANGVVSYHMGGWAPPWGIEYRVDELNAFILLIVSGISTVVLFYAKRSVEREIPVNRQTLFYTCYALCLTGLLGITVTGDAFNVFVFLEISSLSSYALIAMGAERKALTAAFQYLVMGTIGATFILIGIGLLYMMTGTLNMADLAERLPAVSGSRPVLGAFAFITVGLMLKMALFPLHLWLPNAYAYAPSVATAFIAATSTKVAIYVLIRFTFTIFGRDFAFNDVPLSFVLMVPALLAMFAGSFSAIFQSDVKRMLAYSSVAQIGYIVLGIALATTAGLSAGLAHIFYHALMKATLFCAMGCVFYRLGSVRLADLAGLGRDMPWTMAAFVAGGLSLIGIPLTGGFISKWLLLEAVFESGYWWLAALIVASSMLAIVYVWRVVEVMYFQPAPASRERVSEAPPALLLPTLLLAAANIYFGIETSIPVGLARAAAETLLGAAP
jgi:multicomponent Na+:H+ antiporter subunit D